MENIKDTLFDAAQRINNLVAKNHFGDSLNLISICTLYSEYLDENDTVFKSLFDGISNLPKSFGADSSYDIILRYSSATLLGYDELKILGSTKKMNKAHLLEEWKSNPLEITQGQFMTFLFGQYAYRLLKRGFEIEEKYRYGLAYQMLTYIPQLANDSRNEKITFFRFIDQLLFGAVICYKLDVEEIGNIFFDIFFGNIKKLLEQEVSENARKQISQHESDSISFILYNLNQLPPIQKKDSENLKDFLKELAEQKEFFINLFDNELRKCAIALQAYRTIIAPDIKQLIANELASISEYTMLLDLKRYLQNSIEYDQKLIELIQGPSIELNEKTQIKEIHNYIQQFKFKPIDSHVKHPMRTVQSKEGDCKAFTVLLSFIALKCQYSTNLCLYQGRDFENGGNNHVFVELQDKSNGDYIAIDHGTELRKFNSCIKNVNYIIRYPLNSLIKNDTPDLIADISAKRYKLIKVNK